MRLVSEGGEIMLRWALIFLIIALVAALFGFTGIAVATHAPLGTVKTRLELGLQKLTHTLRPLRHKV